MIYHFASIAWSCNGYTLICYGSCMIYLLICGDDLPMRSVLVVLSFQTDIHTVTLPQITNPHAYRSIRSNTLIVCNLEKRCFYCSLIIRYLVKQHSQKHTPRSGALRSSKQRLTREERSEEERNLSRKSSSRTRSRPALML
jgi:hypothetical protein